MKGHLTWRGHSWFTLVPWYLFLNRTDDIFVFRNQLVTFFILKDYGLKENIFNFYRVNKLLKNQIRKKIKIKEVKWNSPFTIRYPCQDNNPRFPTEPFSWSKLLRLTQDAFISVNLSIVSYKQEVCKPFFRENTNKN